MNWIGLCLLCLAAPALAQAPPAEEPDVPGTPGAPAATGEVRPPPAPAFEIPLPPVPDAPLRAMVNRPVELRLRNGAQIVGQIVAVDAQTVTLIVPPQNDVVSFERNSVVGLRAAMIQPPPGLGGGTPAAPPEPPGKPRHFALGMGIMPSVAFDVDYGLFHGFANGSIFLPLVTNGTGIAMSFGGGVGFPISRDSNWRFEAFALYAPLRTDQYNNQWLHGFGVGVGLHWTSRSGLTLGFKIPVLGYSAYSTSYRAGQPGNALDAVGLYYLAAFAGLPNFMVGYRF